MKFSKTELNDYSRVIDMINDSFNIKFLENPNGILIKNICIESKSEDFNYEDFNYINLLFKDSNDYKVYFNQCKSNYTGIEVTDKVAMYDFKLTLKNKHIKNFII